MKEQHKRTSSRTTRINIHHIFIKEEGVRSKKRWGGGVWGARSEGGREGGREKGVLGLVVRFVHLLKHIPLFCPL